MSVMVGYEVENSAQMTLNVSMHQMELEFTIIDSRETPDRLLKLIKGKW
jgi:hypothetical protein